jgi:acetone carboxylase gamma subunit
MNATHTITTRKTPMGHMAICSCGWTFSVPRQNAWARAAKIRAAVNKHLAEKKAN